MTKTLRIILFLFCILSFSQTLPGMTAAESFNDGYRAYRMSRWGECEEFFNRFMETWPDHKMKNQALHYLTIARIRNHPDRIDRINRDSATEWENTLELLKKEFPNADFSEISANIAMAKNDFPNSWKALEKFSLSEIQHFLNRSWHPDPYKSPAATLQWAADVRKKHSGDLINPDLHGKISLVEGMALWQFFLSPLPTHLNSDILKVCGYWPVHTALEEALSSGFAGADPDTKRKIALLGFSYDSVRNRSKESDIDKLSKNSWFAYLSERGITSQEAWFPR